MKFNIKIYLVFSPKVEVLEISHEEHRHTGMAQSATKTHEGTMQQNLLITLVSRKGVRSRKLSTWHPAIPKLQTTWQYTVTILKPVWSIPTRTAKAAFLSPSRYPDALQKAQSNNLLART